MSTEYKSVLSCLLAVIISVACCGKALHSHSESYWRSLAQTEAAAQGGLSLVDNCPVCHYNICFFNDSVEFDIMFFITISECFCFAVTLGSAAEPVVLPALRGSPGVAMPA